MYIYIPSADSLKSLNNFLKRTFVSILWGPCGARFEFESSNLTPLNIITKIVWKRLLCRILWYNVDNNCKVLFSFTDHPTPIS